jgi:hypothetical protein
MHFVQRTPMFTNSRSTMGPGEGDVLWEAEIHMLKKVFRPKIHFLPCWLPYFQDIYQHTFVLYLYKLQNIPVCPGSCMHCITCSQGRADRWAAAVRPAPAELRHA